MRAERGAEYKHLQRGVKRKQLEINHSPGKCVRAFTRRGGAADTAGGEDRRVRGRRGEEEEGGGFCPLIKDIVLDAVDVQGDMQ